MSYKDDLQPDISGVVTSQGADRASTHRSTGSGSSSQLGSSRLGGRNYDPLNDPASDEWYYNFIKQFEGSDFYNELYNNPHLRGNNAPFEPDAWQWFAMNVLGDDSAESRYYGDLLAQRNTYLSDILSQNRQYKQNSPSNQAALMAAAGQNADLLGTSGVAAAPENDSSALNPFKPSEHAGSPEVLSSIANIGMSFISSCLGFAKSIQDLKAGSIALEAGNVAIAGNEIDNYNKSMDFAGRFLVNSLSADEIDTDRLAKDPSYVDDLFLRAAKKIDTSMFSKRTRKQIGYFVNQLQRDPETGRETYFYKNARAELLNRFTSLQSDTAEKRSHSYYSDDLDKMVKTLGDEFTQYYDEYKKLYNKYLKKRTDNDLQVENTPGIAANRATGEMSANRSSYYGAQSAKYSTGAQIPQWEIDKLNNRFMSKISGRLHSFGPVGGFASMLLPGLQSGLTAAMQGLPALATSKFLK